MVPRRRAFCCILPLFSLLTLALMRYTAESPGALRQAEEPKEAALPPQHQSSQGLTASSLRVVHLDLKGAPPRISYLRTLLPLLAANGCTALLVEYEDMFPYHGPLANISAHNAYTQEQILELVSWAQHLGMEVIPLVQTFGHLEFVLKLPEFRHLRELDSFPQEVCPLAPQTLPLLQDMIDQVMSLHHTAKYLHIGCDEVYHLAACSRCAHSGRAGRDIFTDHVTQVAEYVRSTYAGVTPLIWDDMMRHWDPVYLSKSALGSLVEPVVWVYTDTINKLVPRYTWHWYTKTFPRVWVAGAFKGAGSPTTLLPDVRMHFNNQRAWLRLLPGTGATVAGYVLTGWSRYDHFAVLCELLPPSVPSLLLSLILVSRQGSESSVVAEWRKSLRCPANSKLTVDSLATDHRPLSLCSFPGLEAFLVSSKYLLVRSQVEEFSREVTERQGWMTPYNVRHNFTSPYRVLQGFRLAEGHRLIEQVEGFKRETEHALSQFFDKHTVDEWVEQRIQPLQDKLAYLDSASNQMIQRRTWPRRPFGT